MNRGFKILALALVLTLIGVAALCEARVITVQGNGVVNVKADRATISVGVREVAQDVKTAQSRVNEKIDALFQALSDMGVAPGAVHTDGIGIYPNYNYSESGEDVISGYTAYNSIQVTVTDIDNVGTYIDAAFDAGANSLDYVQFDAADTGEASRTALKLAVENAAEKAQVLAEAAGETLGEILEIREGESYNVSPAFAREESAKDAGGTQVIANAQQVSATVTVTYAIYGNIG